jgi:hypothetical protein
MANEGAAPEIPSGQQQMGLHGQVHWDGLNEANPSIAQPLLYSDGGSALLDPPYEMDGSTGGGLTG